MGQQNNPILECMVNNTECYDSWVWVIYLFIYQYTLSQGRKTIY